MSIKNNTDDMRGNIVFYYSYGSSWFNRKLSAFVQKMTHGPYVHVEVVCDKNEDGSWRTIGAHSDGIGYGTVPRDQAQYQMVTIHTLSKNEDGKAIPLNQDDIEYALRWAKSHLHLSYGFIDNVNQAVDLLWPGCPLHLSEPDHYNCSNFIVAIMDKMRIRLPDNFKYPFDTSPNDIAEWCGLLPLRKRIRK